MFHKAHLFNQTIGHWDVTKVTTMEGMFSHAQSFNQAVGDWFVSGVTIMGAIFSDTRTFNQDLTRWDMRSISDTIGMFVNAPDMQRDNKPASVRDDD